MLKIFQPKKKQSPPLVFFHIPKTAGTTFNSILEKNYPDKSIYRIRGKNTHEDIVRLKNSSKRTQQNIQVLMGHHSDHAANLLRQPVEYVTFLRDPVQRTISSFNYLSTTQHNRYHQEIKKLAGIEAFIDWQIQNGMDNLQCRYLAGIEINNAPNSKNIDIQEVGQLHLKNAIAKLESFDFVLITEQFDEALLILRRKLNWKKGIDYQSLNKSSEKKISILTETVLAKIAENNRWDHLLYQHATLLFSKLKNGYSGDLNYDLEKFQQENSRTQDFNR